MIRTQTEFAGLFLSLQELANIDTKALLERIGEDLEASTVARFSEGETPEGARWAGWSPDYAKRRHGGRVLDLTGRLRASMTRSATDKDLKVGTPIWYARVHQRGARGIPARPFLGYSAKDDDLMLDRVGEALEESISRAS